MKKIVFTLFVMVFAVSISTAQTKTTSKEALKVNIIKDGPVLELESDTVDYGTIEKDSEPLRTLKFKNTGNEPLVIKSARGSCGCTVPKYSKEPIMPGESSVLEIRYATNRIGKINKRVTLNTNEAKGKHVIKVVGEVLRPKVAKSGAPVKKKSIIKSGL